MTSLSELSSAVKQTDEDSTKQFIRQLIINAEEHILLHHVNKLLAVPMFQNIIQIPTPEPSGQIKKGFAETCYSTTGWPYKLGSRIIGPRGCTIKAIQILVEADYEREDMVKIIQFDDLKFYENQVEIIKNCFTTQQPYHSDINDASAVSSNDYSVVKRFSLEMLSVLEKRMLTYHMSNLLELPMFRGRIIGPRGLTVKVIQTVCGCRIRLRCKKVNALQVEVLVERDFESIVEFKLWRAFECINCLLKTFSSDENSVNAIQVKDLKLYATQAEMFKVHFPFKRVDFSGADSLNAPLNEKNSLIIAEFANIDTAAEHSSPSAACTTWKN
ncbi:KH domain-containing RNA-binding protein qki.S [Trichinella pseudospiralis]